MADINLLQNQLKDTTLTANRRNMWLIWACAFVLVALMVGGGILMLFTKNLNSENDRIKADNTDLQRQIQNYSGNLENAKILQAKLANINVLLKNHVDFTTILDMIEEYTYQQSQYVTVSVNEAARVHIEGNISTYSDLGKLLLGLSTSPEFKNVKLLAVSPGDGNLYRFSIQLEASPELFISK